MRLREFFIALIAASLALYAAPPAIADDVDYIDGIWGDNASASGSYSYAIGTNADAIGQYSYAIGYNASASKDYSYAIGYDATASANYSYAIGYGAIATESYTISVGSGTANYRIVNLAAGKDDGDAVNVSQLKSLGTDIANALSDGSIYDWYSGTFTAKLTVGNGTYSTVEDALNAVVTTASGNTTWTIADANNNVQISNGTVMFEGGNNVTVSVEEDSDGATVTVALNDDISVNTATISDSLTVANGTVEIDGNGITFSNSGNSTIISQTTDGLAIGDSDSSITLADTVNVSSSGITLIATGTGSNYSHLTYKQ